MSDDSPDLIDVLETWFETFSRDLHTSFPGKVERYDAARQVVDVQPMVRRAIENEDGEVVSEDLPLLPSIPLLFPRMGLWSVTFPVAPGDWVMVLCAEGSIGHVRRTGEKMDAGDLRRHHLSHAVALCGFAPTPAALTDVSTEDLVIGRQGGGKIAITSDGVVHLASNPAAQFLALANKVDAAIGAIVSAFNSHGHGGQGVAPPAVPIAPQASTACAKVKGG
jgi:hypothetical protein